MSHVKHIFTKRNVEKRAQAMSRAQILVWLALSTESGFLKCQASGSRARNLRVLNAYLFDAR
jgi:hypothetical protein